MNRKCCFWGLLLLCVAASVPAHGEWQRAVANYDRHAYGAANQNWGLQQSDNGWIYAANNRGLLEFDGSGWTLYPMRDAKARAIKAGDDGRMYIGGIGQFGYFEPDGLGGLGYVCLSDSLPGRSTVGVVWRIWQGREEVCFQSDRCLYLWNGRRLRQIDYEGEIYTSAILYGSFYIGTADGVMKLEGDRFTLLPGSEGLGRLADLLPYRGQILVVTRFNGIYSYDGTGVRPYACAADPFMRGNPIFCAALDGALLALGSVQGGVCLLDLEKDAMNVVSIHNGLQNKTVLGLFFDARHDLWLGLDNGIDCLRLSSPVFSLYGDKPYIGSGYSSVLYKGSLYLGTNQGLFKTGFPAGRNRPVPMEMLPGTGGQVWGTLVHDGQLFCASDNGIFMTDGWQVTRLGDIKGVQCIIPLHHRSDVLIAGAYGKNNGLHLLRKENGQWKVAGWLRGFRVSVRSLWADPLSDSILWVVNKGMGVWRLRLSADLQEVVGRKAYNHPAFPAGHESSFATVDGEMVVLSPFGLWRYDARKDSLVEHTALEALLGGKIPYAYLAADAEHNLWYASGGALHLVRYDALRSKYRKNPREVYLKGSLIEGYEHVGIYGHQAIAGTEEGFSLIDTSIEQPVGDPASLQIRRVFLTGLKDSLVYGRSYRWQDTLLRIPYKHNSLRIEYTVGTGDGGSGSPLLAYRLSKGADEGSWSEYSPNLSKEFTGLGEGHYVFSVRLKNDGGGQPAMASFRFEVLPPWYRTWWSLALYGLVAILLLLYAYSRQVKARKRAEQRQKQELHRQEQAFRRESELKDEEIDSLKAENLQAELRHKSEELARTTLNIVRKNEILLDIKKEVQSIYRSIKEENLVALRRKSLRLLGQIDTNIEHDKDLETFQSSFDSVHHDFFQRLSQAYPELTVKERMLCAYIQMNLLSKEIAPLLNISVRSVELARYRLRKKLRLSEGENLAEFLQRFSR